MGELGELGEFGGLGGLSSIMLQQNPIEWLRQAPNQNAELKFVGSQLSEIDVGTQKFKLIRKIVSIARANPEECHHEDWSTKTSNEILDQLETLMVSG